MNNGWIKLYIKFKDHAIMKSGDSYLFQLFMFCLLMANWKETEVIIGNEVITLKAGQFITGRKSLVKHLTKLTDENSSVFKKMESLYRRKLEILEKLDCITIKTTNKYTVITIQNWNRYQSNDQQMTNGRPTDDQRQTTDKEYKNIRNKEYIYTPFREYLSLFNKLFGKNYQPTKGRENKLKLRLKNYSLEQILQALTTLSESKFHRGENERGWQADPDFLIRSDEQIDKFLNSDSPTVAHKSSLLEMVEKAQQTYAKP